MSCEIEILENGYSRWDQKPFSMFANGTCTLVKANQLNVIVDTLGPWDRDLLTNKLLSHQLIPDDINYVICTHSHTDHIGNLNLFTNCDHIVENAYYRNDRYVFNAFNDNNEIELSKDMRIISTPGHSRHDISLIVNNVNKLGTVVIAGDLFECAEDIDDDSIWKDAGSECPQMQECNRKRVLEFADYIIPGHGSMFRVNTKL